MNKQLLCFRPSWSARVHGKNGFKEKMDGVKRLLLTGASGFLGWNICRQAPKDWQIFGVTFAHPAGIPGVHFLQADLRKFQDQKKLFETVRPQAVIHAAAVSDPNFCQLHPEDTQKINVQASLHLADLCADYQIPLLFTSSDLVFDGNHPPYNEEDSPQPVSIYGEQKVLAEEQMRKRWPETIICRLPLMFGESGPVAQSFLQPMLKAIEEGRPLRLFTDEFRTPVSGRVAAQGLFMALGQRPGIIHLGGRKSISRYDFGVLLKERLQSPRIKLIPCRQEESTMPAPRPSDVSLDSRQAYGLGYDPPDLKEDLEESLNTY